MSRIPPFTPLPTRDDHPAVGGLPIEGLAASLGESGRTGILSITVLERRHGLGDCWADYETTLGRISEELGVYCSQQMRDGDVLFDPVVTGNSFLLFLGPPREPRLLESRDLELVRRRLNRRLARRLADALSVEAQQRFGVYIGVALLDHEPAMSSALVLHRGVEAAFADAVRQKRAESNRQTAHLQRILTKRCLHVVYQPVVDVNERSVLGFEALTRPDDPCLHRPDLLFDVARREGELWPLERISRVRSLDDLPRLSSRQLLFLNVEPESLDDPQLCDDGFLERLALAGLDPAQVVLEITERSAVRDFRVLRDRLAHCRRLGFRVALDDVGSGYASLQAIAEINPEYLKIDMSLVRDLDQHSIKRELILSIRRFSERAGCTVVAEGVERVGELTTLVAAGVRCAQGYLFARPGSPPDPPDWSGLLSSADEEG